MGLFDKLREQEPTPDPQSGRLAATPDPGPTPEPDQEDIEVQRQLGYARKTIQRLERQLDAVAGSERAQTLATIGDAVAAPLTQLATQCHLISNDRTALEARDLQVTADRLISALSESGIELDGTLGVETPFDPDLHVPLSDPQPCRGDIVRISVPGVRAAGRLRRRAGVERV